MRPRRQQWWRATLASVCGGLLLAACGGGAKPTGLAAVKGPQVLKAATAVTVAARTVSYRGYLVQGNQSFKLSGSLAQGKGLGVISVNGGTGTLRVIGPTAFANGDPKFWSSMSSVSPAIARQLSGRWLRVPVDQFGSLSKLTSMSLVTGVLSSLGTVKNAGNTKVGKVRAVSLVSTKKGTLYVAAAGPTYPLEVVSKGNGELQFSDWNRPFTVAAPPGAKTIEQVLKSHP